MAPPVAMASLTAAAMARLAPKKPWRYYYVLAFPLSNAPPKDKLAGMLELTDSIELREETYLHRMLDRDTPQDHGVRASPLARYSATMLGALSTVMAFVALAALVCVYRIQITSTGDDIDPRALTSAYAISAGVFVQNAALIMALRFKSPLLLRGCVLLLALSVGGVVFLLDEIDAVLVSQNQLTFAISQPRSAFSDAEIEVVLNGGEIPSLWHRFFVDGPAWFLLWLERHCVARAQEEGDGDVDDSLVDQSDFFTPLWKPKIQKCTRQCLSTHTQIETILRGILKGVLIVMATQVVLSVLLLWIDQFDEPDAEKVTSNNEETIAPRKQKQRRRRRDRSKTNNKGSTESVPFPVSFAGFMLLVCYGLVLTGGVLAIVSLTLLTSCSFVGPTESWTLVVVTVFGIVQMFVALCTIFLWRQQLVKSLLVGGLALESYASSSLTDFCASLGSIPYVGPSSLHAMSVLQDAYDTIFQQTCQPMKHWRLHVCVAGDAVRRSPHGIAHVGLSDSTVCQDQLAALLRTSAQHAAMLLSWMMAAQITILVWLLLPSVRWLLKNVVMFLCCWSPAEPTEPALMLKDLQQQNEEITAKKTKQWKHATLELVDARQLYLSTMKRTDPSTMQAEAAAFDAEWMKLTGMPTPVMHVGASVMFVHQFEAIVRTLVLRRLTVQCKIDANVSVSRDGKLLLVRIFASDNLLMATLCQCGPSYKLQLADAIDPGDEFWHDPREIKSDAKLLDVHTVYQRFKLLQLHGVITRKEAEIFPTESLTRVSARVHALMRIHRWRRGTLMTANRHAPFVEYMPQRQLQYLYKRYPNRLDTAATAQQRRSAVLRTIDCLRLTRRILDDEFDLDLMLRHGLIHAFTELHSASRFDTTSRESLLASWVAFWRPNHLPGEYAPQSHWLLNQLGRLSPFRQPLQAVRDYFGECIAFYFAWLACYSQWLLIPTLATTVLLATRTLDVSSLDSLLGTDKPMEFHLSPSAVVFGLAVLVWGTAFAKGWERRSVWHQLEWGMHGDGDASIALADRANFRGVRRRNPVTQQIEVHFPPRERLWRQLGSSLVIVVAGGIHLIVCLVLLLVQGVVSQWLGVRLAVGGSCFIIAMLVLWNGDSISALAHHLSEWENYQNERDFQRGVIVKVCLLQLFNTFGPLLLIAFVLYHTSDLSPPLPLLHGWVSSFHTHVSSSVNVVVELQLLLALIFVTRIASHVLLMTRGLLQESLRRSSSLSVESELSLQAYRGAYEDYAEIFVQLGLVAMFSSVFPLIPVFAFVECALEMRLDALDLCLFLQRPSPEPADSIGPWTACVRGVLGLAAVVNFALLYFVADNCADWSLIRRIGAFLANVLVAWIAAELLWRLVPSESRNVQQVRARHVFLIDKYFGAGGDGGDGGDSVQKTGLGEVEQKVLEMTQVDTADGNDEDAEDTEGMQAHYQERLVLLRRLNTALRKRDETLAPESVEASAPTMEENEEEDPEVNDDDEEEEERVIVGYFLRRDPPRQQAASEAPDADVDAKEAKVVEPAVPGLAEPISLSPVSTEQYERRALAGLAAVHAASERERFDFAHDTGWHHEQQPEGARRGSISQLLSRRFSLFRSRRGSMDATPPSTGASASTTTSPSPIQRRRSLFKKEKKPTPRSREASGSELPIVQLSGLEAVHEAARRDQFDFSTDPWRPNSDGAI